MDTASSNDAFTARDWTILVGVALMWGASFFLIDLGLEGLHPSVVAWLRLFFGAATLTCFPAARRAVPRREWPLIALLGLVWMGVPFLLFPVAQQWIASSLAGMINGAAPLFTAAIAAAWYRNAPRGWQLAGLLTGFTGVVTIYLPSFGGVQTTVFGVGLILMATVLYGVAFNLAAPLQRRNGALPVIWRAQLFALVLVTPFGFIGAPSSTVTWQNLSAMALLGIFSTGLAFAAFTTLVGRVGAARGSVTVYIIPAVAIILGVAFRNEAVAWPALAGTVLVLAGAYMTSRRQIE